MPFRLTRADIDIANQVSIVVVHEPPAASGFPLGEGGIPLQFPPRITDDSKSSNWTEIPVATYEPISIWDGAAPRRIGLEIVYIASGGVWTPDWIATITRQIKSYFYRSLADGAIVPVVKIQMYEHMTDSETTFRLLDASFSFSETLIKDGNKIFPLMTKVKMNLALITAIGGEGDKKQNIPGLPDIPQMEWY